VWLKHLAVCLLLAVCPIAEASEAVKLGHDDARLESEPDVAVDGKGDVAVVWASRVREGAQPLDGLRVRRFDRDGVAIGIGLRIDLLPGDLGRKPSVDLTPTGDRMVVVWEGGAEGRRTKRRVWAQLIDGGGQHLGNEIRVDQVRMSHDGRGLPRDWYGGPRVSLAPTADFVVVWRSEGDTSCDRFNVAARRFSAGGKAIGDQFMVNGDREWSQINPDIDHDSSGRFVIVWQDGRWIGTDQERSVVRGRIFDRDGRTIGDERLLSSNAEGGAVAPSLAVAADGSFACAWVESGGRDDPTRVFARGFSADGDPLGEALIIERATTRSCRPRVAIAGAGRFLVAWEDDGPDRLTSQCVMAQLVSMTGEPITDPVPLSTLTCTPVSRPAVAVSKHGFGMVAWQGASGDGIHLRRFPSSSLTGALPLGGAGARLEDFISGWQGTLADQRLEEEQRLTAAEGLTCTRSEGQTAFQALAACLENDEFPRLRVACAHALAAVTEAPAAALAPLAASLKSDDDHRVRAAAALAIGSYRDEGRSAVPALSNALDDGSWDVRASAGLALGLVGGASAIDKMAGLLDGARLAAYDEGLVRGLALLADHRKAVQVLIRLKESCVDRVQRDRRESDRAEHERERLELFVRRVMNSAGITDQARIDMTFAHAHDRLVRNREGVFETPGELEYRGFFEMVDQILERFSTRRDGGAAEVGCSCRRIIASSIAEIEPLPDWAAGWLSSFLTEGTYQRDATSDRCLSELLEIAEKRGPRSARLGSALRLIALEQGTVRLQAVRALGAVDPASDESIVALRRVLSDTDPEVRAAAVRALISGGADAIHRASDELHAGLSDASLAVRLLSNRALDLIEVDAAVCDGDWTPHHADQREAPEPTPVPGGRTRARPRGVVKGE
jgi:hypothetical protein